MYSVLTIHELYSDGLLFLTEQIHCIQSLYSKCTVINVSVLTIHELYSDGLLYIDCIHLYNQCI